MISIRTANALGTCCLVAALVAGCAGPGSGPAVPPAGTQFDGTYTGSNTMLRGGGGGCGLPVAQQSVTVQNGRFNYPFSPNPPIVNQIPVQIAADGTISVTTQYGINEPTPRGLFKIFWLTLNGHVASGALDITADDQWCVRHLVLQQGR